MDLGLSVSQRGEVPVLSIVGEVDLATVPRLRDQLVRVAADHPGVPVVADLDGVTFMDSTGLGVLVGSQRRIRGGGGELHLVVSSPRLVDLLALTRLDAVFPIHATLSAAMATIRGEAP